MDSEHQSDPDSHPIAQRISDQEIGRFRQIIGTYYRRNGRQFPWRQTSDPYRILVSELMLQQTQTERVGPKYAAFLEAFPTINRLAAASLREVLLLWQGLGYNRRARYLHECARQVVVSYDGELPRDPALLVELPGIGPGTAGAVAAFAYQIPTVFIETNIRRVYLHFFYPDRDRVHDRELLPLIERTLDKANPREWYYALMDYGVYLRGLFTNPNRRSVHYTRQSRFEDSNRQVRGAVIRELLTGDATVPELALRTSQDEARVRQVLVELSEEGMIVAEDGVKFGIR